MIIGLIGNEGGGKSAGLAFLCLKHYAAGGRILSFPGFDIYAPGPNGTRGPLISQEIHIEEWIEHFLCVDDPELDGAFLAIDELQNHFDQRRWNSMGNRLFANNVGAQRRKRGLTIGYTVQNIQWGDGRLVWLTHVLGECRDVRWSRWGREQRLKRGRLMDLTLWDMKGFYTGRARGLITNPPLTIKTEKLWPCFNSYYRVPPWESQARVRVLTPDIKVRPPGFQSGEGAPGLEPVGDPYADTPFADDSWAGEDS